MKYINNENLIHYDFKIKQRLHDLSNFAYGVEWDVNNSSSALKRIGNLDLHRTLPIQNAFRGCVSQNKSVMYYLDPNDWSKKIDGTESRLDGYDGEVKVETPKFYIWSEIDGDKRRVWVSLNKINSYAREIPRLLIDAYRASLLREVPENMGYLSTLPINTFVSIVNNNTYCRGGSNRANYDQYLETDIFRTDLGKPSTYITRTDARTYARNGNKELLCYEYYKAIFYWLYVIEYANFNCQLDYNNELTQDGFRQGGLGLGLTAQNNFEYYNKQCSITPNGYGNEFGNNTNIKQLIIPDFIYNDTSYSGTTLNMPRWRGFDNPFGDVFTVLDGIIIENPEINSEYLNVYSTSNPEYFGDTEEYKNKMTFIGKQISTSGNIQEFDLNNSFEIIPSKISGDSYNFYMCDRNTAIVNKIDLTVLRAGGALQYSTLSGLAFFDSSYNVIQSQLNNSAFRCYTKL